MQAFVTLSCTYVCSMEFVFFLSYIEVHPIVGVRLKSACFCDAFEDLRAL